MVNGALLTSKTPASLASLIRARHCVELTDGTVHDCDPSLGVLARIVVYVLPLFVEYSIFTLAIEPVLLQAMVYVWPGVRLSPPFGVSTVSPLGLMLNTPSLTS